MAAKGGREKIKLESTAGTGHFYTTAKNKKTTPEKLEFLKFDPKARRFSGQAPEGFAEELTITVVASDVDGLEASSNFRLRVVVVQGG